mmetsp:Transcript_370/g.442  ORF Transcript_370/g.442 Transcript_370/m.442 type:complete len:98 (-) Transcript_370:961-1254(-)
MAKCAYFCFNTLRFSSRSSSFVIPTKDESKKPKVDRYDTLSPKKKHANPKSLREVPTSFQVGGDGGGGGGWEEVVVEEDVKEERGRYILLPKSLRDR